MKSQTKTKEMYRQIDQSKPDLDPEWLKGFYSQIGREVSLAREGQRETHNWVITLIGGAIAAVWAIGGSAFSYLTVSSFIVVLAIIPLVFRFFVRSCLEYQIFNRWISIRNALDAYYFSRDAKPEIAQNVMENLIEQIQIYYFQWKQPKSNWKMIWDNFQLAYGWPLILLTILLVWGVAVLSLSGLTLYALLITSGWMLFELINFIRYFRGRYQKLNIRIDMKSL